MDVFDKRILDGHSFAAGLAGGLSAGYKGIAAKARPELKAYLDDISEYDNVFVCGPCWWGTFPMAVVSQLERLDFTGKKVFSVMTHEGSGLGGSERTLKQSCKGAEVGKGLAVHGAEAPKSEATVAAWAKKSVG